MLTGGPNYTSLAVGALLGFGLLTFFLGIRRFLARQTKASPIEETSAIAQTRKLNVRFSLGAAQSVLMLCIVFSFIPIFFGFRGEGVSWLGFSLLLLFQVMLATVIFFALRKKDLSWSGSWADPSRENHDE